MRKKLKSILKIYPLLLLVMIFVAAKAGMSMASSSTTLRNAYQKMYKPGKVEGVVGSINFMGDFDVNGEAIGEYPGMYLKVCSLGCSYLGTSIFDLKWIKKNPNGNLVKKPGIISKRVANKIPTIIRRCLTTPMETSSTTPFLIVDRILILNL